MENCIFCKIANKEIKSDFIYEDKDFFIIKDAHPKARYHFLAIPKKHYGLLAEATTDDAKVLGRILFTIPKLSKELHLEGGYRLVVNQGENGGQAIPHLHIHILSGEKLRV